MVIKHKTSCTKEQAAKHKKLHKRASSLLVKQCNAAPYSAMISYISEPALHSPTDDYGLSSNVASIIRTEKGNCSRAFIWLPKSEVFGANQLMKYKLTWYLLNSKASKSCKFKQQYCFISFVSS